MCVVRKASPSLQSRHDALLDSIRFYVTAILFVRKIVLFFSLPFTKTRLQWNSLSVGPCPAAHLFQEGGAQSYRGGWSVSTEHPHSADVPHKSPCPPKL